MFSLKTKAKHALGWDVTGTLIRQGSGFVITIFLARLLEPEEFGEVGMSMVFITIIQVFVDIGFTSALIQNKTNTNITYSSVFYINILSGIILTSLRTSSSMWYASLCMTESPAQSAVVRAATRL